MRNTDIRNVCRHGKPLGLNWELPAHGGLPNPVHSLQDSASGSNAEGYFRPSVEGNGAVR